MKKIFYISLTLLILVLIFLGAYNFAFKNNANSPLAATGEKQPVKDEKLTPPLAQPRRIENLINEETLGVVAGVDDSLYYYSLDDRAFKKSTREGKNKTILLSNLPGTPSRILWSQRRGRVLMLLKQSNGQSLWHYADLTTKTLTPLKPEISRLAWNNLGDKILYQYTDKKTGVRSLDMADPDGNNWKKLADLSTQEIFIAAVPQNSFVSFWSRPNALEKTIFETVGITGDNRQTLLTERFGADYLWSPDGSHVLVNTTDQTRKNLVSLNLMNSNGGEYQSLSIPTFVSKIVWTKDSKSFYYALPTGLPENAVLPNDYFDKPLYSTDTFWKMDIANGKQTRLVATNEITQNFDSTDLFLSPSEDTLFFTDRKTRRLYQISL